jgi:hypothetical protein
VLVSSLLFFTLDGYLEDIEKLWMNEFITPTIWERFITNQLKEWTDGTLLVMQLDLIRFLQTHAIVIQATVMLTVDVSFLTIPGVVLSTPSNPTNPNKENILTSPALIAIILSLEASIASIVIGMILARYNSNKVNRPPTHAVSEYS